MTIKVNLKIFLFAIIFYFTKQIRIYAIIMFFALCHEIGHLIGGLILGLKPKALQIMPMGISIEFKVLTVDYNKKIARTSHIQFKKLCIAIMGPLTNLIIIILMMIWKEKIEVGLYKEIIYSNIIIAIFNLLPIYPLDGARVIKSIIHIYRGGQKSWQLINLISNATVILLTAISSVAIYYYKNFAILFVIIYLWGLVIMENRRYEVKKRIYKIMEKQLK